MLVKDAEILLNDCGITVVKSNTKSGEINCLCPLHDDSSPSLAVNAYSGKFQCFAGCIKGTKIGQLVEAVTGNKYIENEEIVAKNLFSKFTKNNKLCIIPMIPKLPLALNNDGHLFLKKKKILDESIKKWNILWDKSDRSVVLTLPNAGYIKRFIDKAITKEKYKYIYGTRITDSFFCYDKIKTTKSVILVEGAFDAIYLHQMGLTNALALGHADMSDRQIQLLKRLGICVLYLLLDNDQGGINGSNKIKEKTKDAFIVKQKWLPNGKDPNDCTKDEIFKALKENNYGVY